MLWKKVLVAGKPRRTASRTTQKGDVLLDALVAMLLACVIGLGPAYVAARATVVQTQGGLQNLAAVQMRSMLSQQGPALCDTTPSVNVGGHTLDVTVQCGSRAGDSVTVGGKAISMNDTLENRITLSVTSQALFGGAGTIEVSQ